MQIRLPRYMYKTYVLLIVIGLLNITAQSQTPNYNFYFGNTHSHTWYSDGNQDQDTNTYKQPVAKAILYGRTVANNLDWLGITDHNHSLSLNMTMSRWRAGNAEADTANKDGIFVGFYGQEWGTLATGKGHSLVLGTNKLFGWQTGLYDVYVPQNDYSTSNTSLWRKVLDNGGFIYLAHPSSTDFDNLASNPYNTMIDSVLKGVAIKSGPAYSTNTTQTDPSSSNYQAYYHSLLRKGYHVAPTSDQDNHYTNFGMSNQQRTIVLAPSLTRANIIYSLKNRRVYASEDNNIKVQFEVGSNLMGDIFSMLSPFTIRVKVSDATPGDIVSKIEIRYGVPGSGINPTVLATVSNRDSLIHQVTQENGSTFYYYVYVEQVDGHKVWTAPMWITSDDNLPVTFGSFSIHIDPTTNGVVLNWSTISEINCYGFHVQRMRDDESEFITITENIIPCAGYSLEPQYYSYIDTTLTEPGKYFYRIQQIDNDGLISYSQTDTIYLSITCIKDDGKIPLTFKLEQNYPNPFNPSTVINYQLAVSGYTTLKVYNILGKEVATLFSGNAEAGRLYNVNFDASNLSAGVYVYKLQSGNNVQVKKLALVK